MVGVALQVAERSQRAGRHVAVGLALLAITACSDDGDADDALPDRTTTSTTEPRPSSTTTTSTEPEPEAEITERYQRYWEARFRANQSPPDPDDPALERFATGEQLAAVVRETRRNLDEGLALRRPDDGPRRSQVDVVTLEGDVATLQECYVDDGIVFRPSTGEVVNDVVATHSVVATMERVDGEWKLARAELVQRWEGVAGCALAEGF